MIVGLGNPGPRYENTRHNLGFMVLDELSCKLGIPFKKETKFKGDLGIGKVEDKSIIILKPMTYMNLSGQSVAKVAQFFKIESQNVLVVADDISLPLSQIRLKRGGSSGGHNGLTSIQTSLNTNLFPRLKIGVGDKVLGTLEDYVLSPFLQSEMELLSQTKIASVNAIMQWLLQGIDLAMNQVNRKCPSSG